MKPIGLKLLVASSLLLSGIAHASTRPQYGGTVRVVMRMAPNSLDPLDATQVDSAARRNLTQLLFDTLVVLDDFGREKPSLATSWQAEPGNQKWRFLIRHGVKFDDGSPLTPALVAAALRSANPSWTVYAGDDSITISLLSADPALAANLAQARNAVVRRTPERVRGTGPFQVSDWQPGKKLVVVANEEYWAGRPYVDAVQIDFGVNYRDQLVALDLNKADVIEIAPEQAKRAAMEGHRIAASAPIDLMAIVFTRNRQSAEDGKLRRALALSIDRNSIRRVLLQGTGEPAGGILPNWMTGYEFVFPAESSMEKAREQRIEVAQAPVWTMGFNAADTLTRLVAERVALNARDAGIPMQTSAMNVDLRVVQVPTASLNPQTALAGICSVLGLALPALADGSIADSYRAENTLLESQRIIPLFHLPVTYGLNSRLKNWEIRRDGTWALANTWISMEKP